MYYIWVGTSPDPHAELVICFYFRGVLMKKSLLIASVLVLTVTGAAAVSNSILDYFSGRMEGDAISLEWKSGLEAGLKNYVIERSTAKSSDYQEVSFVKAQGSYATYRYRDVRPSLMPTADGNAPQPLADLYKYRLKLVYDKEISYSQPISVSRPSSGVKRTWGMIKEMFH
jgi:hypothetical protein